MYRVGPNNIVTIGIKLVFGNPTMMKGHSHGPVVTAIAVTVHCCAKCVLRCINP